MEKQNGKKVKEAAALKYTPGSSDAPRIIALGRGEMAEKILETAKGNDVPVYEDANLAHTLNSMNIGADIPSELYEVVAEILVFVSRLDNSYGELYGLKRKSQ